VCDSITPEVKHASQVSNEGDDSMTYLEIKQLEAKCADVVQIEKSQSI
jgi:hypothetical protein